MNAVRLSLSSEENVSTAEGGTSFELSEKPEESEDVLGFRMRDGFCDPSPAKGPLVGSGTILDSFSFWNSTLDFAWPRLQ